LSNGGGFAPLVPQEEKVRGYVVAGGWSKTWFEHMLELERRRLKLGGKKPGEVTDAIKGYAEFYTDYLRRKMTPREILKVTHQSRRPFVRLQHTAAGARKLAESADTF
jgi:hypothetical protein